MMRGDDPTPARSGSRRGSTRLVLALAALALPTLPSPAFAATSVHFGAMSVNEDRATTATTPAPAPAPYVWRHHSHATIFAEPGPATTRMWAIAGWSSTVPSPQASLDLPTYAAGLDHHHDSWPYRPIRPVGSPSATGSVLAGCAEAEAYQSTYAIPALPARSSVLPTPMLAAARQTLPAPTTESHRQPPPALPTESTVVPKSQASPCLLAAHRIGSERYTPSRSVADSMAVILEHHRAACATSADYLSPARA